MQFKMFACVEEQQVTGLSTAVPKRFWSNTNHESLKYLKKNVKYIMTSHIGDQNTVAGYQTMAFRLALHTYTYSHMIGCFPMAEYYCKNQQKQF